MSNFFSRRGAAYTNQLNQSFASLVGIATGTLADRELRDSEIHFLKQWLEANSAIATTWPGDLIYARVSAVLADGVITESERLHLIETLQKLIGGTLDDLASATHVTELAFDDVEAIAFQGNLFCLTGDFVLAPRSDCEQEIESRGGIVKKAVSKKVDYLIVGGLGSPEWKHGSFGTKIEHAIQLKREGVPIALIHENTWIESFKSNS